MKKDSASSPKSERDQVGCLRGLHCKVVSKPSKVLSCVLLCLIALVQFLRLKAYPGIQVRKYGDLSVSIYESHDQDFGRKVLISALSRSAPQCLCCGCTLSGHEKVSPSNRVPISGKDQRKLMI